VAPSDYPALNKDEISKWMSHVPVYAVTDFNGDAKAIQLENKAIVYFFMSSLVADTYKKMIQDSSSTNQDNPSEEDLTVSGMFLGKIWLDFIQPEDEIHVSKSHITFSSKLVATVTQEVTLVSLMSAGHRISFNT
jgi:hypothetical protein